MQDQLESRLRQKIECCATRTQYAVSYEIGSLVKEKDPGEVTVDLARRAARSGDLAQTANYLQIVDFLETKEKVLILANAFGVDTEIAKINGDHERAKESAKWAKTLTEMVDLR